MNEESAKPAPPPAGPIGRPIRLGLAGTIATSAMEMATALEVPMAIAIVEPTGDLVHFVRMEGAPYSSIKLAIQKAVAAARYRRPTKTFYDALQTGNLFFLTFPDICATPGGEPLLLDGEIVGAIGVSGGNGEQDVAVSSAGASAL